MIDKESKSFKNCTKAIQSELIRLESDLEYWKEMWEDVHAPEQDGEHIVCRISGDKEIKLPKYSSFRFYLKNNVKEAIIVNLSFEDDCLEVRSVPRTLKISPIVSNCIELRTESWGKEE